MEIKQIDVIEVKLIDVERLQEIGRQTFFETFFSVSKEGDMQKYLRESFSREKLSAEINNPCSEFYFAVTDRRMAGYLKINFGNAQTEIRESRGMEIERIYVLKEFQGRKVGQRLYEKALQIARQKPADYIWLGVWEKNTRAVWFYRKNGFVEFDKHTFMLGNDNQTDIMMKLELNAPAFGNKKEQ